MYILYQWDNKQEHEILTELSLLKYTDSQRYVQFLFSTIKSKKKVHINDIPTIVDRNSIVYNITHLGEFSLEF